ANADGAAAPALEIGTGPVVGVDKPLVVRIAAIAALQLFAQVVEGEGVEESSPNELLRLLVGVSVVAVPARTAGTVEIGAEQSAGLLRSLDGDRQALSIEAHGSLHNGE